jgi:hypothetical protein
MVDIEKVKIRARIDIGSSISVETPYILSFNVRKTRGQVSTFDASLKVRYANINMVTGEDVVIRAGEKSASDKIFTDICKRASVNPCFDDPYYCILNVSGEDVLSLLRGKKYTRRCVATKGKWVEITNVQRKGLKSSKFKFKTEEVAMFTPDEVKNALEAYKGTNPTAVAHAIEAVKESAERRDLDTVELLVTVLPNVEPEHEG